MKDIEFRAWDGKRRMDVLFIDFVNCAIDCIGNDIQEGEDVQHFEIASLDILEQYTGLLDKNGKKIFEGDIVKANGMSNGRSWNAWTDKDLINRNIRIVSWGDNGWILLDPKDMQEKQGIGLRHGTQKRFELIGNIHENADLLEDI